MRGLWLALAALLCSLTIAASAQAPALTADAQPKAKTSGARSLPAALKPTVLLSLNPTKGLAVGDALTLKLDVTAKTGVEIAVPEQPFEPFELIGRRARSEALGDKQHFVFELDLLALESGKLTVPAVTLRVVGPNGELGDVTTAPRTVDVQSLIANEPNAKPRPPTKPVVVMQDDYTLAWIGGGLLAIALVAGATLLISRWLAKRPKALPPPPPPRPPWELALEKLAQLDRRKEQLFAAERGEEFIDGVSEAVREYLGKRYGFDGLESTTDEVLRTLERVRPHKLSLSGVSLLLEQCDLVKFARVTPDLASCDDLWNGAVGLVRATTPAPAVEPKAMEARP